MTDHSPNLLIGLLGILKSGNGFLPLDPQLPIERLDLLLSDSDVEIVVTEGRHLEKVLLLSESVPSLKHIICLDQPACQVEEGREVKVYFYFQTDAIGRFDKVRGGDPGQTAYLIYTSGSTGVPKGVYISHQNLAPLLVWSKEYFKLDERSRVLQNLSYYFDFGLFEILTTISFGGALYFLDKREVGDPSRYADFIYQNAINTIHSTPSLFKDVLSGGGQLTTLETLHLGGEQLTVSAMEQILRTLPGGCVIYNGYGPTETTINSSIYKVDEQAKLWLAGRSCVPIGKASAHNEVYVLDRNEQPVPIGVVGELYIAGDGLAAGYQNRPELTAEKFIPNLFSECGGERLYRTGDLCRRLTDGNIEFIRRRDKQLKVRGYRIELGEIESMISQHPSVKEAVVAPIEVESGRIELVGYFLERDGSNLEERELRRYLKERLPEYMTPSKWVKLEKMPLTPTGKMNRAALPSPAQTRPLLDAPFVDPRTHAEESLAGIWAKVLRLERVGVKDNFFELGGQSLLAAEACFFMTQAFQLEIPLRLIFNNPTIEELALAIEGLLIQEIDSLTEDEAQKILMNGVSSV